jgi:hypothetical protein
MVYALQSQLQLLCYTNGYLCAAKFRGKFDVLVHTDRKKFNCSSESYVCFVVRCQKRLLTFMLSKTVYLGTYVQLPCWAFHREATNLPWIPWQYLIAAVSRTSTIKWMQCTSSPWVLTVDHEQLSQACLRVSEKGLLFCVSCTNEFWGCFPEALCNLAFE